MNICGANDFTYMLTSLIKHSRWAPDGHGSLFLFFLCMCTCMDADRRMDVVYICLSFSFTTKIFFPHPPSPLVCFTSESTISLFHSLVQSWWVQKRNTSGSIATVYIYMYMCIFICISQWIASSCIEYRVYIAASSSHQPKNAVI